MQSGITKTAFGTLPDGRQASLYTLVNRNGVQARISDYGGIIVSLLAPDRDGKMKDIVIREGETFFVPGNVPHSPTRPPNTLGLVVERRRPAGETEHLQWYCEKCYALVEDIEFDCKDIVEHFKQAMEDFWTDADRNACKKCGTRITKPKAIKRIVFEPAVKIEREA